MGSYSTTLGGVGPTASSLPLSLMAAGAALAQAAAAAAGAAAGGRLRAAARAWRCPRRAASAAWAPPASWRCTLGWRCCGRVRWAIGGLEPVCAVGRRGRGRVSAAGAHAAAAAGRARPSCAPVCSAPLCSPVLLPGWTWACPCGPLLCSVAAVGCAAAAAVRVPAAFGAPHGSLDPSRHHTISLPSPFLPLSPCSSPLPRPAEISVAAVLVKGSI
jgi:hypothetical protein